MKRSILVLLLALVYAISYGQTPCDGASGVIQVSGYSGINDNFYQSCAGTTLSFMCTDVVLPDNATIMAVYWFYNNIEQIGQSDGSLILSSPFGAFGNIRAEVASSSGCMAYFELDMPVMFIPTPEPVFEEVLGTCNAVSDVIHVNYNSSFPNISMLNFPTPLLLTEDFGFSSSIQVTGVDQEFITDCNDLESVLFNMEHSYIGDLEMTLTCPNGTSVVLKDFGVVGGATFLGEPIDLEDNQIGIGYNYSWSMDASQTLSEAVFGTDNFLSLPSSSFIPDGSFCDFIGCPTNGVWTLAMEDLIGQDNGFVFSWGIHIPNESDGGYDYSLSENFIYEWSSNEFDIVNDSPYSAEIILGNNSSGSIEFSVGIDQVCGGSASTDYLFIDIPVSVDAGENILIDPNVETTVNASVVFNNTCIGQVYETSICFGDDASEYYTYCGSDFFECSGALYMLLSGPIEAIDIVKVWEGTDTALQPIFDGTISGNTVVELVTYSGCFTVQIISDGSVSCATGFYSPLSISLTPNLSTALEYSWTPTELFATPEEVSSLVYVPTEDTWVHFSADVPNFTNCSTSDSLLLFLPDNSIILTVFHDENENGIFDSGENTIPYFPINADVLGTLYTNSQGTVFSNLDEATSFEISIDESQWSLTTPSFVTVDESGWGGIAMMYYFGITPTNNLITNVEVSLEGINDACNMNSNAYAICFNEGNYYPGGEMVVHLDPLYTVVSTNPEPISIDGNDLTFEVPPLFLHEDFFAVIEIQNPDEAAFGQSVINTVEGYYTVSEGVLSEMIDSDSLNLIVTCAYDPNNKITHTGIGEFNDILQNTSLEYTVNFQNIGNAEAQTVVITDMISANLDISTLQPIASSHDFTLQVVNNEASFVFENINLPGVVQDELASHGFVRFRIEQQPNLAIGTIITNEAEIVFDENSPIITNTVSNRIYTPIGINETVLLDLDLYPNPTNDFINWNASNYILKCVINSLGETVPLDSMLSKSQCNLKSLPGGIYIFNFVSNSGDEVKVKVVKQ